LTTTTATLNNGDQQNSKALASGNGGNAKTGGDANAEHDYITMADCSKTRVMTTMRMVAMSTRRH
jgi:hypothetical protein